MMRAMSAAAVAGAFLLLVGCGGTEPEVIPDGNGGDDPLSTPSDAGDVGGDSGDTGDAPAVITVDGTTYSVPNFLGGKCQTVGEPERNQDLAVFGYEETGQRIELSFTRQDAEFAPSGQEEFYGSLSIASGQDGQWQVSSLEPWPWLEGDRSSVSSTVTMADTDGNEVEVSFEVTCP